MCSISHNHLRNQDNQKSLFGNLVQASHSTTNSHEIKNSNTLWYNLPEKTNNMAIISKNSLDRNIKLKVLVLNLQFCTFTQHSLVVSLGSARSNTWSTRIQTNGKESELSFVGLSWKGATLTRRVVKIISTHMFCDWKDYVPCQLFL